MLVTNWYYGFDGDGQAVPKFPKQQVYNVFTISPKKVRDDVDSLYADEHQSFLQVDFNTLVIKVSYKVISSLLVGMIKHSQSTKSNKIVISLQYLKKEVIEFTFCMQINIKVSTSWHYCFW